jgi:quinol-cytochrome oxidoreductase complex cytochrome b subunit
MILVLNRGAADLEVQAVLSRMAELGLEGRPLRLGERTLVHVTGGRTPRAKRLMREGLVQGLVPTSGPRVRREGRRFHPYHTLRISAWLTLLVGGLSVLAGSFPRGVGLRVLPGQALPAVEAWPWYLRPFRAALALLPDQPAWVGPLALVLIGLALLSLPFIDRSRGTTLRERAPFAALAAVAIVLVLAAVLWGGLP